VACFTANPTSFIASKMPRPGFRIVRANAFVKGLWPSLPSKATLPGWVANEIRVPLVGRVTDHKCDARFGKRVRAFKN